MRRVAGRVVLGPLLLEVLELDVHPQHREFRLVAVWLERLGLELVERRALATFLLQLRDGGGVALRGLGLLVVVAVVRRLAEEAFFIAAAA